MKKIAFRLNSDKAVEYANAHRETYIEILEVKDALFPDSDAYFHKPSLDLGFGPAHLDGHVNPGYLDVTDTFLEQIYKPWKEGLLPLSCEDEEMVCERNAIKKAEGKVEPKDEESEINWKDKFETLLTEITSTIVKHRTNP